MMVAKSFQIYKCGHKVPKPASKCILSLIGENNSDHFIVASQDNELRYDANHYRALQVNTMRSDLKLQLEFNFWATV